MTFTEKISENILLIKWIIKDYYDDYRIEHSDISDEEKLKQYTILVLKSELTYVTGERETLLIAPLCIKVFDSRQEKIKDLTEKMGLTQEQQSKIMTEAVAPFQKNFLDTLTEEELEEIRKMNEGEEEDCK